jgi:Kef-type K+ transport system membrane component KefB
MTAHLQPKTIGTAQRPRRNSTLALVAYAGMILAAVSLFFIIRAYGNTLSAPPPDASRPTPSGLVASDVLWHLFAALTAVIVVGRLLGRLFRKIGQPPVIGEVVGGVLLGPSCLGAISPAAYRFILAPDVLPYLGVVAQLGVVLYMFLVGLDLNVHAMRGQVHATVATSHASIVVPFVLGSALALYLYPRFSTADVPFTSFTLFTGIAMSITAFPVLARILSDLNLTKSEVGGIALTCAAVDDVTAWCLLALLVGVAQASAGSALVVTALTVLFILLMFGIVRPWIAKALHASLDSEPSRGQLALVLVGVLVSALVTEAIGVHALFGAFLFGAVIPHNGALARTLSRSLDTLVTVLLLPAFFAFAGMRTEIGLLSGWAAWVACGLIILVATLGKFGGTFVAARAGGLPWRVAAALGILMNTRGLMQLIVLNVGLDLGIITPTIFTMMVLMALVTTVATTPVLRRLLPAVEYELVRG